MTSSVLSPRRPRPPRILRERTGGTPRNLTLALIALALGGFAIGTTEYVTMGLLPEIAAGIGVSIPSAGHVISAYAVGVVVGAPLIVSLTARLPKHALAIGLVAALALGNMLTAVAPTYETLLGARFLAGLPHGAYFGVASLIAASMVSPQRRGRAVASVMLGLAAANLVGVPASTFLGQQLGWRSAYWVVVGLAVVTMGFIGAFVPQQQRDTSATVRRELRALRQPQVLLTAGVGAIGFGGLFAVYSYIAPITTDVSNLSASFVPWVLLVYGIGSILGTALGGRLADHSLFAWLCTMLVAMAALLALFAVTAQHGALLLIGVLLLSTAASALGLLLQMRLMHVAGSAKMLGAALNHSALNAANALGAWLGGLVIAAGFGYIATAWVGVGLSFAGLAILVASAWLYRGERLALSLSH
ncbi:MULTISPECIES: MFS transporter [Mumia]|uniref:MFS transporter n=1 Tax=Mumia xiangluensis TaxID=1678900 RepID=A0ABW1QPH8_9ACTN|nr:MULTISPECIES: MFS transporter [Mumia]